MNHSKLDNDYTALLELAQAAALRDEAPDPETLRRCRPEAGSRMPPEQLFDALSRALLEGKRPSRFFRALRAADSLEALLPELAACVGVPQNPVYHPEGDVFEHTMIVVDCAAELRGRAVKPLAFMLAALAHDLGKTVTTEVTETGKVTSYGHEVAGLPLCEAMLRRLTDREDLIEYAKNMMWLHMRPNVLAQCRSKRKKTRQMFDLSCCPEDLILLSRADASGKLDRPYDEGYEAFLRERLEDYRRVMERPMATASDLLAAGLAPGEELEAGVRRARELHFSGLEKGRALKQVLAEVEGRRVRSN